MLRFVMVTTLALKSGSIGIVEMLMVPLVIGAIVGIILMYWTQIRVSAFVLFCAFLGATQIAPTVAKYINRIIYGMQGGTVFDLYDIIFALFGIELTDFWTLVVLLICMITGTVHHLKSIKKQGYSFDAPLISYETNDTSIHGRID